MKLTSYQKLKKETDLLYKGMEQIYYQQSRKTLPEKEALENAKWLVKQLKKNLRRQIEDMEDEA